MDRITTMQLDCGLTLAVEPIPNVASVALYWLLPVGAAGDPADGHGLSTLLSELIFRGAGGLSSREHSDALDRLGVDRSSSVTSRHLHLRTTLLGDRLDGALPLITAMVRKPALPEDALEPVRRLALQELASLDDDPQHLVMLRLSEQHRPPPFNRHGHGDGQVIQRATIGQLREQWAARARPEGAILGVAGAVDPEDLAHRLDDALAGWSGAPPDVRQLSEPARGRRHIEKDTAQVHLGLAYDAPREADEASMLERLAAGVLSGGTSGRLFTEVRQKRSLCYSVGASYRSGRDYGMVALYAGTTPDRAAETLEVCTTEINRLKEGAARDEFERAVVRLKSRLVMSGEATSARAAALAQDQYRLGRPRTLDEIAAAVDRITLEGLNAYLAQREFLVQREFTVVDIGPIEIAAGAAAAVASQVR